eukprot:COSAG06_NODE_25473_length_636_cov_0.594041_2_plen_139_part_01
MAIEGRTRKPKPQRDGDEEETDGQFLRTSARAGTLGAVGTERMIELLSSIPLLSGLEESELAALATEVTTVVFDPGEEIIAEGSVGDAMYFVDTGDAHAEVEGAGILCHYERGDFFGEMALLKGVPRVATIRSGGKGAR